MTTLLKLGKADHGRPLTLDEFWHSDYAEGYRYELIDGKLYVCPSPNLPEAVVERWIHRKLDAYSTQRPDIINAVFARGRVFVPNRPGVTVPEPDVMAYHDFPLHVPFRDLRWQDVNPVLAVEVFTASDPNKDLVRNVELYFQVPTIREYWIFNPLEDPDRPTMRRYRRYGGRWQVKDLAFGETYTTRLLPGFALLIDPHT
jgi:Uma2 family endonuclease